MTEVNRFQLPHRKPVGGGGKNAALPRAPGSKSGFELPNARQQSGHMHSRTISSSIFPMSETPAALAPAPAPNYPPPTITTQSQQPPNGGASSNIASGQARRTVSNATASTASSYGQPYNHNLQTNPNVWPRRSTSGRSSLNINSSPSPTSYVALLRKQKATVWCDRAQQPATDQQGAARARAAKIRANLEITGPGGVSNQYSYYSNGGGGHAGVGAGEMDSGSAAAGAGGANSRLSTSSSVGSGSLGVRNKIAHRYHHAGALRPAPHGTYPANLLGTSGVVDKIPAREMGGEDDQPRYGSMPGSGANAEDDAESGYKLNAARRTGSGRSSLASASAHRRATGGMPNQSAGGLPQRDSGRLSSGSTPPSGPSVSPQDPSPAQAVAMPAPSRPSGSGDDYFYARPTAAGNKSLGGGSSSGNSSERGFGQVGEMGAPSSAAAARPRESEGRSPEELSRRGSVDERTTTMKGVRLFVANPDPD